MANTGVQLVRNGANSTLEGTKAWSNTGNVVSNNNVYATVSILSGETSNILRCYNPNMSSIPSGASIDGIQVKIYRQCASTNVTKDNTIRLMNGTSFRGVDRSSGTLITTSEVATTKGSSGDMWGTSWTPAIINASTFGVGYGATWHANKGGIVSVDYATIQVWYSEPAADPTGLTIDAFDASSIDISWTDNATNEDNYAVERQVNGGGWSLLDGTLAANTTSYSDTTVSTGNTYEYRVQALSSFGDSGYSNTVSQELVAQGTVASPIFFD